MTGASISLIFMGPPTRTKRSAIIAFGVGWAAAGVTFNALPSTSLWLIWSILLYILGLNHPPTRDLLEPLNPWRKAVGWASIVIFVLTFIHKPLAMID